MKTAMPRHQLLFRTGTAAWVLILFILLPALSVPPAQAASSPNETLLMFVGEETKVLGIASRREQTAWQAPAIARVITRDEIRRQGIGTLAEALENVPGYYLAEKEWGSQPYLRGIPDSVLFLYDTVPLGSEVTKSIHQLDHDLALWPVKRIEIINGPGSVLWGPDAFAGIVNVVPLTGKDFQGVESGLVYGAPGDQRGGFLNAGYDGGPWNAFVSISGRKGEEDDRPFEIVRFKHNGSAPIDPEDRLGRDTPGEASYVDVYGHLAYRDWLTFSGRFAYNDTPYTMTSDEGAISWGERRRAPHGFVKLEAKHELDPVSALKFTGFYSHLKVDHDVIDISQTQNESTFYGEMVYDRSVMAGSGIFTGGLSYRRKNVDDAPVWNGYLPGFLESNNPFFLPKLEETSYNSDLWSLFGQFMKTVGSVDLFVGARHDRHEDLTDQTSVSAGLGWSPAKAWRYKLLYGTAYRTPFARQFYDDDQPGYEEIHSFNLQVSWERPKQAGVSATGFYQEINDHVMEDPYAGLSLPNNQSFYGMELDGFWHPFAKLKLQAGLTLLTNEGPDERYRYIESISIDPDTGELIKNYAVNKYPYDMGPEELFNLRAVWQALDRLTLSAGVHYTGPRTLLYPRDDTVKRISVDGVWRCDAGAVVKDVFRKGLDLEVSIRNLFDQRDETPGTYDLIETDPFTVQVILRVNW